ncbi:MAG: hypothetical protein ACT4NY_07520 [Pseudonocardiales bacterium]
MNQDDLCCAEDCRFAAAQRPGHLDFDQRRSNQPLTASGVEVVEQLWWLNPRSGR